MTILSRRSVLRSSLALATAGSLTLPDIARAAAITATVWWVQGFAEEEDVAFKKMVAEYEKASGENQTEDSRPNGRNLRSTVDPVGSIRLILSTSDNKIDYSIIPYAPERQKIVSAVTSGAVPDLFQNNRSPGTTNSSMSAMS